MVPTRIWLSFQDNVISVQTKELEYVDDLALAAQNRFSRSLGDFDTSDIFLHTKENAEPLNSKSLLSEYAEPLSDCANSKTPLIVKGKPPLSKLLCQ
jgi:hypothetical protein